MHTGSCQCGEIQYESQGEPEALYICHCQECQKQSASAFGISLYVPRSGFRLIKGQPKYWNRTTSQGKAMHCAFCPNCGSRLWHETDSGPLSIKAGSLTEPLDVSKAVHVWVKRKLPGVLISPDVQQFQEED